MQSTPGCAGLQHSGQQWSYGDPSVVAAAASIASCVFDQRKEDTVAQRCREVTGLEDAVYYLCQRLGHDAHHMQQVFGIFK